MELQSSSGVKYNSSPLATYTIHHERRPMSWRCIHKTTKYLQKDFVKKPLNLDLSRKETSRGGGRHSADDVTLVRQWVGWSGIASTHSLRLLNIPCQTRNQQRSTLSLGHIAEQEKFPLPCQSSCRPHPGPSKTNFPATPFPARPWRHFFVLIPDLIPDTSSPIILVGT